MKMGQGIVLEILISLARGYSIEPDLSFEHSYRSPYSLRLSNAHQLLSRRVPLFCSIYIVFYITTATNERFFFFLQIINFSFKKKNKFIIFISIGFEAKGLRCSLSQQ